MIKGDTRTLDKGSCKGCMAIDRAVLVYTCIARDVECLGDDAVSNGRQSGI